MNKEKAQVATEYLMVTGFILMSVTLIFAYAYISNNQNIKISQASISFDKMVNAADLVYALGPGNIQYIGVVFPQDIVAIKDITVCESGAQGYTETCSAPDSVKFGAIEIELKLFGGTTKIIRGSKAELELDTGTNVIEATPGVHRIKVEWCESKICLTSA